MPGDNFGHEIARALEESEAMVVLLTPEALHSPWVKWEIESALSGTRYRNRLIPVLVGDPQQLPEGTISPGYFSVSRSSGSVNTGTTKPKIKPIGRRNPQQRLMSYSLGKRTRL